MKNISFDKNILYIGDKNIVFEDEIFQVKIEDDKIYVLLDIKPKEKLIMFFVILGKDEKYGR